MNQGPTSDRRPQATYGEKAAMIVCGTLFLAVGGFAAIAEICDHQDYDLFGRGGWDIIAMIVLELLASLAMILALLITERVGLGNLATYIAIGIIVGAVGFKIGSTDNAGKGY
jgi:hypothetical protein